VKRRCTVQRSLRANDNEVRISVEVLVDPHPLVPLTVARTLMLLWEELQADHVPVHLVQVAVTGQLGGEGHAR
jgi:hypothetical protein